MIKCKVKVENPYSIRLTDNLVALLLTIVLERLKTKSVCKVLGIEKYWRQYLRSIVVFR